VFRQKASPWMIVIAVVLLVAVIAGIYLALLARKPKTAEAPVITNDPYASQYTSPPTKADPEAVLNQGSPVQ